MSAVTYEFILFSSPRAQTGVVVAHPPRNDCPVPRMVVAVVWELKGRNPMVHVTQSPVSMDMLEGILLATNGAIYGRFTDMIVMPGFFSDIAHQLGIAVSKQWLDQMQFAVASTDILPYLKEELEYIAKLQRSGYYEEQEIV